MHDVVVVGGGIVGLASAYQVQKRRPGADVVVLEKEHGVATHQTGHNSGVIHSGIYYRPGSEKAVLCARGRAEMLTFCDAHGIDYRICGKLIVATAARELPRMKTLQERARANGVPGVRELSAAEIHELEPEVAGIAGLEVPGTGIVDYREVCRALSEDIVRHGGSVLTDHPVQAVRVDPTAVVVGSGGDELRARFLVNCAGLQSDRVARSAGLDPPVRIVPFRGEYFWLRPGKLAGLHHLIYPVPDPDLPFLGVHVTLSLSGRVEVGPNAVLAFAREGYRRATVRMGDIAEFAVFPGFWSMARRNWWTGVFEGYRSIDRARFAADVARLVPAVETSDLGERGAGVRAQAVRRDGALVDDFVIQSGPRSAHVLNAPSPAATSALAIGAEVASRVVD
jgi:(S)-2-hydroxyglutarate dehydrogenase